MLTLIIFITFPSLVVLYLWHVNRGMTGVPAEAHAFSPKRWTRSQVLNAYKKTQESPTDVKPFLLPKKGRRYIVVGGSGLVGSWIVQHLLWRGEDASAIRIIDFQAPTRPEVAEEGVEFIQADVADESAVKDAFGAPWKSKRIATMPLTVFHTVAYIKAHERKQDFMSMYEKVNVAGTRHVLDAAKSAGATCFVSTSSGSIAVRPPKFFLPPWRRWPEGILQVLPNAEPRSLDAPLEDFGACYAFSKARAERLVRSADDKTSGFRTGCIRPAHTIYGHKIESSSNLAWEYLQRGGDFSWLHNILCSLVNAQNVSIAHLALEARLTSKDASTPDVGGRAYCCLDPGACTTYGDLYTALTTLAHPTTPVNFPPIPPVPLLLLAYCFEFYYLLRVRYLPFLPLIRGNIAVLTPPIFNLSTTHLIYDDAPAREELGYKPAIGTMEGLCLLLLEWNAKIEKAGESTMP